MPVSILISFIVSHLKTKNNHPVPFLLCCALLRKWDLGLTMKMSSYLLNRMKKHVPSGCRSKLFLKVGGISLNLPHTLTFTFHYGNQKVAWSLKAYIFYCHWKIPCSIFIKSKERLFSKTSYSLQNCLKIQGSKKGTFSHITIILSHLEAP